MNLDELFDCQTHELVDYLIKMNMKPEIRRRMLGTEYNSSINVLLELKAKVDRWNT